MPRLADSVVTAPHSGIREIGALAARLSDAIRLELGDPDFATPPHIIEAASEAARQGFTKYTPSAGLASLRELIAEKVQTRNRIACSVENVTVTTGACGGLFTSLRVLLEAGDEVLVPNPGWSNYQAMVHLLHGRPVFYPLRPENGFEPDPEELTALIGPRTKALIVNSPSNPTGAVYSAASLHQLIEATRERDLWLISDEAYDELVFEGQHLSPAAMGDASRVISVFSFSKTYAMTGWRVGYIVAANDVAAAIATTQESIVTNASSISQKAAEAALTGPQESLAVMRNTYRARRDTTLARLDADEIGYMRPKGALYLMVKLGSAHDSRSVALRLLDEERVAVVPGSAFGSSGEGMVRVSLCVAPEQLNQGIERLISFLGRLRTADRPESRSASLP